MSLFDNFALYSNTGLRHSIDELFVAFCCASIAAPVLEICSLKVQNTSGAIVKRPVTFRYYIHKHGNGIIILPGLRHRKRLLVSNLARMLGQYHGWERRKKFKFTENFTQLHVFVRSDTLYIAT